MVRVRGEITWVCRMFCGGFVIINLIFSIVIVLFVIFVSFCVSFVVLFFLFELLNLFVRLYGN